MILIYTTDSGRVSLCIDLCYCLVVLVLKVSPPISSMTAFIRIFNIRLLFIPHFMDNLYAVNLSCFVFVTIFIIQFTCFIVFCFYLFNRFCVLLNILIGKSG